MTVSYIGSAAIAVCLYYLLRGKILLRLEGGSAVKKSGIFYRYAKIVVLLNPLIMPALQMLVAPGLSLNSIGGIVFTFLVTCLDFLALIVFYLWHKGILA